ncbi:MAG: hypothetical protein ACOCTG_02605, partial [Bacteroidota bacterium]
MTYRSIPLLAIIMLMVSSAAAQDREEQPVLPDIAPRTVEIRGQLEINFPALERQPLVGFNPPPRIVDLSGRSPYMEPYRQSAADLPPSPLQPPSSPAFARLEGIERRSGQIEARTGRYLYRNVDARLEQSLRPDLAFSGHLYYRGLDGHEPFDFDPEATSAADDITGRADLHYFGQSVRGGVGLDGFYSSYLLFGASGSATSPPLVNYPTRSGHNLAATAWLQSNADSPFDGSLRARLTGVNFETQACAEDSGSCEPDNFSRAERSLILTGESDVDAGGRSVFANARFGMSGIDGNGLIGTDVISTDAGIGAVVVQTPRIAVRTAARMLYASSGGPDQADYSRLYMSPDIRLDFYPGAGLQIFAENRPSVDHPSLSDIHRENPYVVSRPALQAEIRTVDARTGIRLFSGPTTVDLQAGVIQAPEWRYFEHAPRSGRYTEGVSRVSYDDARILRVSAEASVLMADRATANLGIEWRRGRLTG